MVDDGVDVFNPGGNELQLTLSGPPEEFRITDFHYDGVEVTLTWESVPGARYSVLFSTDLTEFEADVVDSFPAAEDADETTYTFPITDVGVDVEEVYFQVARNAPEN